MRAYLLSIGSELILGHLTDTNATFLAQEFVSLGIELLHVTQVGDDLNRLTTTVQAASRDADLIVCTGGVGPTADDLTREAIAAMVGEVPVVDPDLLDGIRAFFAGRGLTMPEQNAKQAWVIPSSEILPNPVGTAPGWFVRANGTIIVAMPGVPREMFRMWHEQVVPRLQPYLPERAVRSRGFKTIGIGESAAASILDDLIARETPIVATYAKDDGVHIRVTAIASTSTEAEALLDPVVDEIRRRLRDSIYAEDDRSLGAILVDLLGKTDQSLGLAEVRTGGRFGNLLLEHLDAGHVVKGVVAYAADGQSESAARSAAEWADQARHQFGASLGMAAIASITPDANGLVQAEIEIAITGAATAVELFPLRATFAEVQRRAALNMADVLRRALTTLPSA
ncbi:MAG: CinA family nicotinamide mononucleotide deamidase-related protein [Chloroflexota bacterium]|nr:CinA family nicotinamide mononucleotide deamidase-related protein [Chloroflexota bacterium]